MNFNHTNMRPMVSPKHVPLKQQRIPITQTGRHSEILINDSKLNHTKRATNCRPYYTTIHLYESVCKSHKPKHRLTKQLCISQKQQTQYYLLLWAVYIYISTITNHIFIHCQSYRCKSNRNQSQQPAYIILFHNPPYLTNKYTVYATYIKIITTPQGRLIFLLASAKI